MVDKYILKRNEQMLVSDEFRELLESLGTVERMHENTYLFYQGKKATKVYLIKSGLIRISMDSSLGTGMTLRICQQDDLVGELILYCDDPGYLLNAKVIESGEVIAVDVDILHRELLNNHVLAIEVMKWINNHMRRYQMKMKDLLLSGKQGALYSTLIRLTNSYGVKQKNGIVIDIVLSNRELANFCGASREYVNRMLRQLRENDILSMTSSGKILIKDLQHLKDVNHCEKCPIEVCNIN